MSSTIKQAIQALKGRIADAYTAISNKGGTLPATQDCANLPTAIASIPSGGGSGYTGHIDEAGLRAIGWIDRDIEWLESVKDWNEEDDDLYKVPQELITAYTTAGNTWSENLSQTYAGKWWFKYRPRGGEGGSFANNETCLWLLYIPNYEIFPWNEMRAWGYAAKGMVINGLIGLYQIGLWNSPSIIWINSENSLTGGWGWLRDNSSIREIHGILNCSSVDFSYTDYTLTSCQYLSVIWIKNLKTNIRIPSRALRKECLLYMINNESAESSITITLDAYVYQYGGMSTDTDVLAALANHPNITLAQG